MVSGLCHQGARRRLRGQDPLWQEEVGGAVAIESVWRGLLRLPLLRERGGAAKGRYSDGEVHQLAVAQEAMRRGRLPVGVPVRAGRVEKALQRQPNPEDLHQERQRVEGGEVEPKLQELVDEPRREDRGEEEAGKEQPGVVGARLADPAEAVVLLVGEAALPHLAVLTHRA